MTPLAPRRIRTVTKRRILLVRARAAICMRMPLALPAKALVLEAESVALNRVSRCDVKVVTTLRAGGDEKWEGGGEKRWC